MGSKFVLVLLSICAISCSISAEDSEEQMEKLFSSEDETYISTELQRHLEYLEKHKLSVNTASYEDLLLLPWLSDTDVRNIITYRKTHQITMLQQLSQAGLEQDIIDEIKPYISTFKPSPVHITSRIRAQYKDDTIYESPLKFYQRYQLNWKNYSLYFLAQKDEGEKNWLDFWSTCLYGKDISFIKTVALGNYRLSFGQGMLFAPKMGLSKGGNATHQPVKHYQDIKPYTSTNEAFSLFGVAVEIPLGNFSVLPFYSNCLLDGTIKNGCIKSLDITGFHRNDSQEDKKDAIRETLYGAHISFGEVNTVGITAYRDLYDHPFCDTTKKQKQDLYSVDFYQSYNNVTFFGEGALTSKRKAFVAGMSWREKGFENLLLYRNYEKNFPTFHGNPFHEGGDFDNERGLYYGITFRPFKRSRLDIYFDVFRFPQEKTYGDIPTYGFDSFLQFEKRWKASRIRLTYHHKQSERWRNIDNISKLYQIKRNTHRCDFIQKINDKIELKFRGEFTYHHYTNTEKYDAGILLYQEIKYFITPKLKNYLRFVQYHTDDIILYMYENDLDGIMLNSQFKGDGVFYYLLLKYDVGDHISIQVKYSEKIWKEKKVERARQIKLQLQTYF